MAWVSAALSHPYVLVACGGAAGSAARHAVARGVAALPWQSPFPWATMAVNVGGSFLLGVIAGLAAGQDNPARRGLFLLLGTGFCGGFTTFSTFEADSLRLIRDGRFEAAAANLGGGVAAGLVAVWAGVRLAGRG